MKKLAIFTLICWVILIGCNGGQQEQTDQGNDLDQFLVDSNKATALQVGGVIFCIPSPFQTAFLIKETGANYSKDILNGSDKINSYSTTFAKALNLGIYGADLGYTTIYEQPQDGINYLKSVQSLADELGVSDAFSQETIKRITDNLGNQDSLLGLVSVCYRSADEYLKNNDAGDRASLIITGGWIESMFFVTEIAKQTKNPKIINRIGGQKQTLDNIIKLLGPYSNQPEFTELIDMLVDLYNSFEGVEVKYVFVPPTIFADKKLTKVNSTSDVVISEEQISAISQKLQSLRNLIVG